MYNISVKLTYSVMFLCGKLNCSILSYSLNILTLLILLIFQDYFHNSVTSVLFYFTLLGIDSFRTNDKVLQNKDLMETTDCLESACAFMSSAINRSID